MNGIHPARVILDGWCPRGKEEYLFFKCVECHSPYDEHIHTLMETGVAKCPLCQAHHHISILELQTAMAKVKKLREAS